MILHQIYVSMVVGVIGLIYCAIYETFITARGFKRHGANWLILHNRKRTVALLGFTMLWPAMEEVGVRGVPMLITTNRLWLACVLIGMNVLFMVGHLDRDIIAADTNNASFFEKHSWVLSRFGGGLLFLIPAVGFLNLYGCVALHAAWNLQAAIVRLRSDPHALRHGRIIVWSVPPFELLVDPNVEPNRNFRKVFRNMQTYRMPAPTG